SRRITALQNCSLLAHPLERADGPASLGRSNRSAKASGSLRVAVPTCMGRTCSKPTIPVQARRRESMELDGAKDEDKPRSKTRMKTRPRLASVTEEVVIVSNDDPRREE